MSMEAPTITDLRSYASGVWPVPRPVDGFGRLAAARAAPDRLLHLFRNRFGIGKPRAWAEYRWRHPPVGTMRCEMTTVAPSGAGTSYGITARKDGPLEPGEQG